jgi:putative Ca2+/H+ antiporter (TMEM165/GDT1 family)
MAHQAQRRLADPAHHHAAALTPIARSWAKRTAIIGAVMFLIFGGFYLLPDVRAANEVCGRAPDVLSFELSRSIGEIDRLFADTPTGCRAAMIKGMDAINHIDLPWFILVYAAFMASASLFQSAKWQQRRWLWGLLAAAVALVGDLVETGMLLRITQNLSDFDSSRSALIFGTWMKWLGIGGLAGLNAALALRHPPRRLILGGISLAATIATILALFAPGSFGMAMGGLLLLHWFALWVDALRSLRRH